jgi:hypothetical protein
VDAGQRPAVVYQFTIRSERIIVSTRSPTRRVRELDLAILDH